MQKDTVNKSLINNMQADWKNVTQPVIKLTKEQL